MTTVKINDQSISLEVGESVLEGLERASIDVASGCRAGTCCKCMLQADGAAPSGSQRGVRTTLKEQGFFLSCQAYPDTDLVIQSARVPDPVTATLDHIEMLSEDVARLRLRFSDPSAMDSTSPVFDYRPGQYLDVLHSSKGDECYRSYSIASLSNDGFLELHVRRIPGGVVSGWLHGQKVGAQIRVRGPFGQCFYLPDKIERKLVLVGAGTGLAPLVGITREALRQGHRGAIDLVHGAVEPSGLYLREELDQLAAEHPQLRVYRCVLREAGARELEGPLDQIALRVAGPLKQVTAFLCGDDQIVRKLQRSLFLAGVPSGEILADPFTPAPA